MYLLHILRANLTAKFISLYGYPVSQKCVGNRLGMMLCMAVLVSCNRLINSLKAPTILIFLLYFLTSMSEW